MNDAPLNHPEIRPWALWVGDYYWIKAGSNEPKIKQKNKYVVGVSWFLNVFFVFWGVLIIPKRLIIDSGHIAIFFEPFWNFQKCDQISTLIPLIYYQNISKV